jgi:hypothetical protein
MTTKACSIMVALCCATPALAQQNQIRIEWSKNVTEYRGQDGRRVTLVCPPKGQLIAVFGTDTYTDDTGACSAAVHAGRITLADGGVVTIVIGPGQKSYAGSARNGVESRSFGSWSGSFSFEKNAGDGRVDWTTQGVGVSLAGRPISVVCPPGGESANVWGTDIYTDDSSICVAAVHAGLITFATGGRVAIEGAAGQQSYAASDRNGVRSRDYGSMPNSFRFSGAGATAMATATSASASEVTPTPTTTGATLGTVDAAARSGAILSTAPTTAATSTTSTTSTKTMANAQTRPVQGKIAALATVITTPQLSIEGRYMRQFVADTLRLRGLHAENVTITTPRLTITGKAP